ncbi:MAG TPA: hypothetical protein VKE22_23840 [Haliangiales bacterium]|nr:hypothetical protein [Haliangiales bacterium]
MTIRAWCGAAAIAVGFLSAPAAAADYINVDATDFSACPGLSNGPIPTDPGTNTSHLVGVPSGSWYSGNDPDHDPASRHPFAAHSWYGTNHHWVFVSTADGIAVVDLQGGTASVAGTLGGSSTYLGLALVDYGVAGERTLVALRSDSHIITWRLAFSNPTAPLGPNGDLDLNQPYISYVPFIYDYACSDPAADAGSGEVIASTTHPGTVFVTNECTGAEAGSIDVVDVTNGPVLKQRTRVDKAPTGMALGPNEDVLYLTNEKAGVVTQNLMGAPSVGSNVGALMTFDVVAAPSGGASLSLATAVNAGCTPVRVVVGTSRVWVTARGSNDLQVFDAGKLLSEPPNARISVLRVGPEPVGLKIVPGNRIAVANSYRTDIDRTYDSHMFPRPSLMVFSITTLGAMTGWGDRGHTRLLPTPCFIQGTANGYGDFPRNLARDDERLYATFWGASALKWVTNASIDAVCP